ncbi:PepSY domain-containing protein [Gracilibacillus alcaliphilus]|uniref:PepSY domain-containing protein n=1 Tax=Gracilibacillus alcaliphilus TaxID=1401441 RepID=UPI00195E5A25|nr:PepSY domain-containing protein [Gracilibacillus alcaliphilus]MBM7678015.1 putative membrane protein YkoI [Gracilibacillus alcaliphilus]
MNKKIGMIAGVVALAGVIGTGVYHAEAASSNEGKVKIVETENLTMEEATKKLEEEYRGTIKELELDQEDNKLYYEAEIIVENQEYDVKMDAVTGEVVYEEIDDDRNQEDKRQDTIANPNNNGNSSNLIAQEEAIEIAKQQFDGKVVEMELDYDDGRYVYELELVNGHQEADIDIDGETGNILSLEIDYEDD